MENRVRGCDTHRPIRSYLVAYTPEYHIPGIQYSGTGYVHGDMIHSGLYDSYVQHTEHRTHRRGNKYQVPGASQNGLVLGDDLCHDGDDGDDVAYGPSAQ